MKTLYEAGVREVVYTTNDGKYQVERVYAQSAQIVPEGLDIGRRHPVEL